MSASKVFDTIIRNGLVVDGTGSAGRSADVAIRRGGVAEIAPGIKGEARKEINAAGKIVAPGFIDLHSHADFAIHAKNHDEILKPLVMQGITTFVGGNCGFSTSFIPREHREESMAYLEKLSLKKMDGEIQWQTPDQLMRRVQRQGLLLNMGLLVGHGSLRIAAAGSVNRLLTPEEQRRMERYLSTCLEMGCLGLSTGLQYYPGSQSDTAELVSLGGVLKRLGGIFTSHLRSYSHTLDLALEEVLSVGRANDIPVQVSHLYWQPYTRGMAGIMKGIIRLGSFAYNTLKIPIPIERGLQSKLEILDRAVREGVNVHFDQLPTAQGFTELLAFLPPYVHEGGRGAALKRLEDPAFRKRVQHDLEHAEPDWPHRDGASWSFNYVRMTGWGGLRVMAVTGDKNRWMEGKTFPEIGKANGRSPMDSLADLLIDEKGQVLVFHTPTRPDDPFVERSLWAAFTHPRFVPATDTILLPYGRPAHVFYDCFPRFIKLFVRERKMLTIEEAVHKSTSLPARIMGIQGRGELKKGACADIVIFDLDRLDTKATFHEPDVFPTGIETVIINGEAVVSGGQFNKGVRAGSIIRKRD
ncbi:MAG: amidohydrolase family protein [Spirochaetes bacterium]|nr:amidohydrolase family protein [Spirochaetota bacterium]